MKIAELEEQLQISRANIRFYEKEGLINPQRKSNGYREYSEEDSHADTDFDQERYWNLIHSKEVNGQRFGEFLKDYMQFEKKTFFGMWKNVFFLNIEKFVKDHGWLTTFCVLFFVCVIRGLSTQFIWKSGSFFYGFLYPFVLLAFGSLFILPLFLLERKYKEDEAITEFHSKPSIKRVLFKLLGALVYAGVLIFGIPSIMENHIYNNLFGQNVTYVLTSNMFIVYLVVGLYLLIMLLWLFSKQGIFGGTSDNEPGLKAHLPKKAKIKVAAYSIVVFLLSIATYMSWFNCFTENGLRTQRLFWSEEYTWDDVDYYKLTAAFDGTLKYTVFMKDGTRATCLGTGISMMNEDEADENLCRNLTQKFAEMGIEAKVKDWDKLEKKLTYDYWKDFVRDIKELAGAE